LLDGILLFFKLFISDHFLNGLSLAAVGKGRRDGAEYSPWLRIQHSGDRLGLQGVLETEVTRHSFEGGWLAGVWEWHMNFNMQEIKNSLSYSNFD
jgi:hypothetical protein